MRVLVMHLRILQAPWAVTDLQRATGLQQVTAECASQQAPRARWARCVAVVQRAGSNLVVFVLVVVTAVRRARHNSIAAVHNCACQADANVALVKRRVLTTVIVAMECAAIVPWACRLRWVAVHVVHSWSLVQPQQRVVRVWSAAVGVVLFLDVHHRVRHAERVMRDHVVVGTNVVVSLRELNPSAAVRQPSQPQRHKRRVPAVLSAVAPSSAKVASAAVARLHKPASVTSTVAAVCSVYVLLVHPPPRWEPVRVNPAAVCVSRADRTVAQAPPAVRARANSRLVFGLLPCLTR
jgi:hypothetical protein